MRLAFVTYVAVGFGDTKGLICIQYKPYVTRISPASFLDVPHSSELATRYSE